MIVLVRQLKSNDEYEVSADECALMVPHELPDSVGLLRRRGDIEAVYEDYNGEHLARVRVVRVGNCHPGERVAIEFEDGTFAEPPGWWLCEVQSVGGDDVASS